MIGGPDPLNPGMTRTVSTTERWRIRTVDTGLGGVVSLDYYAVTIETMPRGFEGATLLSYLRLNVNDFVDTDQSAFSPYPDGGGVVGNTAHWESNAPLGSLVTIDIPMNNGTVLVSSAARNHWTFTTVESPLDGLHPVSGNRRFGIKGGPSGTIVLYTRGVDRLTDLRMLIGNTSSRVVGSLNERGGVAFAGADDLWRSLQQRLVAFVRAHGGVARAEEPVAVRPRWSTMSDLLQGRESVDDFVARLER